MSSPSPRVFAAVLALGLSALAASTSLAQPEPKAPAPPPGPGAPAVSLPTPPGVPGAAVAPAPPAAPGVPAPTAGVGTVRTGELRTGDATQPSGEWIDNYPIEAAIGEEILAAVTAFDFDPYVMIVSPSGDVQENDDFGGSRDVSLLVVPVHEAGTWRIRVTSYEPGQSGPYALVSGTRPEAEGPISDETFAIAQPVPPGARAVLTGAIAATDPVRGDGSSYDGYGLDAAMGQSVTITMESPDFDAYLTVVSPEGHMSNDDDGGGGTNARVMVTIDEPGTWTIVANTLSAGMVGNYTLTVERN